MSTTDQTGRPGRRVIFVVYLGIVGVAATMGLILGIINPEGMDPTLFGVIDLPPTPLGMVIFGVVTIGVGLGVLLGAVALVAAKFDDDGR